MDRSGGSRRDRPDRTRDVDYVAFPVSAVSAQRGESGHRYEHGRELSVTISIGGGARTLEQFLAEHRDDTTWLRKDRLPDGFLASFQNPTYDDPNDLLVHLYRGFGVDTDHANEGMTCHAELKPANASDVAKTHIPLVEKICSSLKMLEQHDPPRR